VNVVIHERCVPCHSAQPTLQSNPPAPIGVRFEAPEDIAMWRERIKFRAVLTRTMPLGNKTGMTDDERELLARWFMQGASTSAQLPR
jgi:uncharacterized membrane protein